MAEAEVNVEADASAEEEAPETAQAEEKKSVVEDSTPSRKSSHASQGSRLNQRRSSADRPPSTTSPRQASRESQRLSQSQEPKQGPPQDARQVAAPSTDEETDEEFRFYLQFVKSLVFYIRDINDRGAVSSWILKLQQANSQPALRVEYVKLLLFCLHRRNLPSMFCEKPDPNAELAQFPDGMQLNDMIRRIIAEDNKKERGGGDEGYISEASADMKEYVAVQRIPSYGAHFYLAVSDEPMTKWNKVTSNPPSPQVSGTSKPQIKSDEKPKSIPKQPPMQQELDWTKVKYEENDESKNDTRLAGGGGGITGRRGCAGGSRVPRKVCTGGANLVFPDRESEMEDDYLDMDEDEIGPSAVPKISRLRNKLRPPPKHYPGPESRASQRVVREEDFVDAHGHEIRGMVVGQGVSGSYRDTRDGVTIRMRKTMAARDLDTPPTTRKCQTPVKGTRHAREILSQYEPEEKEYYVCPSRPTRAWSPQSRYAQYKREEVPCYPCADDDVDEDFNDYGTVRGSPTATRDGRNNPSVTPGLYESPF